MLQIPIYSMEVFADFIYFGGGGGYEIKNQIVCYRKLPGVDILKDSVQVIETGTGVANFLTLPKDRSNVLIALIEAEVHLF